MHCAIILVLMTSTVATQIAFAQNAVALNRDSPSAPIYLASSDSTSGTMIAQATTSIATATETTATVDLSTATVVVDAARNFNPGADDLAAARAMFRSASYPESSGGLQSSADLLNGINVRAIRIINDESGCYIDPSTGAFVPSARLGWDLPWIKRYGYNPHVIVGQRCPTSFSCPARSWDASTWAAYQEYAYRFVRGVATEYDGTGFPEVMFEVGNEDTPDERHKPGR